MNNTLILALLAVFDAQIVYFFLHRVGAMASRDPEVVGDIRQQPDSWARTVRYLNWASGKTDSESFLAAPWKREISEHLAELLESGLPWTGQGEWLLRIAAGRCQG